MMAFRVSLIAVSALMLLPALSMQAIAQLGGNIPAAAPAPALGGGGRDGGAPVQRSAPRGAQAPRAFHGPRLGGRGLQAPAHRGASRISGPRTRGHLGGRPKAHAAPARSGLVGRAGAEPRRLGGNHKGLRAHGRRNGNAINAQSGNRENLSRGERLRLRAADQNEIRELRQRQRRELRAAETPAQRRALRTEQRRKLRDLRAQQRLDRRQEAPAHLGNNGRPNALGNGRRFNHALGGAGRFAGQFWKGKDRSKWRSAHIPARRAWRRGLHAAFVPWFGSVYYPYAYADVFDYTFWPYAYDPGYWAYAYDDFFDGIYFPSGGETTGTATANGSRQANAVPGQVGTAEQRLCAEPGTGITAWPFDRIERAVRPTEDQKQRLGELKDAAARAADAFKSSCNSVAAMTPPGRLQLMKDRLQAALDAVRIVRPPLEKFYASLSDEQKARFNAIGPKSGATPPADKSAFEEANGCGESKPGLINLPIARVEESVRPTAEQQSELEKLRSATSEAVDILSGACPGTVALTPVGRLEQMEKRLDAMVTAANTIQPALLDFYTALSNEQKARFNTLGKEVDRE
jgi:hypothetical protein